MNFLPDVEDGLLLPEKPLGALYTPPKTHNLKKEEENLSDLNNLGRKEVTEDFADSPHADRKLN